MMLTLYRRNDRGQLSQWTIHQSGNVVERTWGVVGGKQQTTRQFFGAIKKKAAWEVAAARAGRLVKAKHEAGFSVRKDGVRASNRMAATEMTFDALPRSFAPQKPMQELTTAPASMLIQRKRDGQRHFALVMPNGRVRFYSRTMHDMTSHFPRIVRELEDLDLPPRSILDGEILCDRNGRDDFRATNEVCRALPAQAARREAVLPIRYMVFDYLYRGGTAIWKEPYCERWEYLLNDITDDGVIQVPTVFKDMEKAKAAVTKHNWEGLVIWDMSAPNVLRMDGKPQRNGCYKWKPLNTSDFVAIGWSHGNGRLHATMGRLHIAEWQHGKLVEICRVGSGFDNKTRDAAMRWNYPLVVELEYAFQQQDTRALREPIFKRVHPDKRVKELRHV